MVGAWVAGVVARAAHMQPVAVRVLNRAGIVHETELGTCVAEFEQHTVARAELDALSWKRSRTTRPTLQFAYARERNRDTAKGSATRHE